MDMSSFLTHPAPTSRLSSPANKSSTQEGDEENRPNIPPDISIPAKSPPLSKTESRPKSKSKSKSKTQTESKSKSKSKPKPKPIPTRMDKQPKQTKAKSGTPSDPKLRPWTTSDKITLLNIVSSRGASIKHFEGAVEGRSGLACYIRWKHIILRGIRSSLMEEAKSEKKAGAKAVKAKEAKEV